MKNVVYGTLLSAMAFVASSALADSVSLPPMNLGNTSFLDGVAAPGFLFEMSSSYYRATRIKDSNGNTAPGSTSVDVAAVAPHIAYISPSLTLLGGHIGGELLLPLLYTNLHVGPGLTDHNWAAGDVQFSPFLVQWTGQTLFGMPFFQRFDLLLSAPTGQYHRNALANAGSHAWTVTPYYAFTIMPTEKFEVSARLNYQWTGKNTQPASILNATSVQAGDALSINLSGSYAVSKSLRLGVAAYTLQQLGEDRINGIRQTDSKERVFGAGPGIVYMGSSYQIILNAYKEFGARNRPEGNKVVLRYLAPF